MVIVMICSLALLLGVLTQLGSVSVGSFPWIGIPLLLSGEVYGVTSIASVVWKGRFIDICGIRAHHSFFLAPLRANWFTSLVFFWNFEKMESTACEEKNQRNDRRYFTSLLFQLPCW